MSEVILVTGASSGFGAMAARALAKDGSIVYASMRETRARNAAQVEEFSRWSDEHGADLRTVELDALSQKSVDAAFEQIIARDGHLDVLVHNAGHMAFGPAAAFTPEQYAELYDVNVLSTQRVNRTVLPHFRERRRGLVVWVSSSCARGGTPPYLAPYFASKAAMDALAVSYSGELARWGIETSIIVPGAFTKGTSHFLHAGTPADQARAEEYERGPTAGLPKVVLRGLAALEPPDAEASAVAAAIARVVALRSGDVPSALMSIRRRMVPRSLTPLQTASARNSCGALV
ncbi:MAG TPA: SDR family oxidoreductase [Steroidobacteraceae bacterium]|nr:SDR family oxidoreductase [Steroidobacteraceae bacterium]